MNARSAMSQYKKIGVHSNVTDADPHRLIQMLLNGALERLATAKGHMERHNIEAKGKSISSAIAIIGGLQASLNMDAGGDISSNLDNLYDYMQRRLFQANIDNDVTVVDEVVGLLYEIKIAWDQIPEAARKGFRPATMQ